MLRSIRIACALMALSSLALAAQSPSIDSVTGIAGLIYSPDTKASATGSITVAGTLKLTGDNTTITTPTLSNGSTVEYSATSSSRTLKDWAYYNLKINGAGGTFVMPSSEKTLGGTLNIAA
ncbi:MAG: hypothetical protein WCL50_05730, partial [Spirochaetota bacterium]